MRLCTYLRTYFFAAILVFPLSGLAQQFFPADDPRWKFDNDQVSIENLDGRQAIKIRSGKAVLEAMSFEDGLIEFDMYVSSERAFAYLYFRIESDQAYEEIYFRTHKSAAPDALQYAPVFQRRSAWQLYHGD